MTARDKANIKAFFEQGDKPTEAQFEDLIDSYVDKNGAIGGIETAASGGNTGFGFITSAKGGTIITEASALTALGVTVYTTALSSAVAVDSCRPVFTTTAQASAIAQSIGGATLTTAQASSRSFDITNPSVITKTAAYEVTAGDNNRTIFCDSSAAAFTIDLPGAADVRSGFRVGFKKTDTTSNALTVSAADNIDGSSTFTVSAANKTIGLISDGSNWYTDKSGPVHKKVLGTAYTQFGGNASTSTQIPADNTIPQSTEGAQITTLSYTPKSSTSILVIEAGAQMSTNISANTTLALFKDSDTDALTSVLDSVWGSGGSMTPAIVHEMDSPGTSAITFKLRFGPDRAATSSTNAIQGVTLLFNGTSNTYIRVTEIES